MKLYTYFLAALLVLSTSAALADGEKYVTSADCRSWFDTWAATAKADIATELKAAQGLKIDSRAVADATLPVQTLMNAGHAICLRLDTQKVRPANPSVAVTPAQVCADAFGKWEDEMDNAYSVAVFANKISDDNKELVPAQDLARREAKLGKVLCSALTPLH